MANPEESSPLLPKQQQQQSTVAPNPDIDGNKPSVDSTIPSNPGKQFATSVPTGWTADGLPLAHGSVMGEPIMGRAPWNSSLCACLGQNDEFCSSDLEVCLLGSVAPCVLYGSNAERLGSAPGAFANHCLSYTGLFLIGNSMLGSNLAPCFSYTSRTAIRRKFNLEGSCEAFVRSCGCCGSCVENEVKREQCETACDFATHVLCHACALCQEGREVRRRLPHPGFHAQQILVMIPPSEQIMGRGA